jgi:hypothetical protein
LLLAVVTLIQHALALRAPPGFFTMQISHAEE